MRRLNYLIGALIADQKSILELVSVWETASVKSNFRVQIWRNFRLVIWGPVVDDIHAVVNLLMSGRGS